MADDKYSVLRDSVKKSGRPLVAFSGGVDSSVLAVLAHRIWGDNMLAVTLDSPTTPKRELESALKVAVDFGFPHKVVAHNELDCGELAENPADRCYYCKRILSQKLKEIAVELGFDVVLEGTSLGDLSGHRPGYRALQEEGVVSPLVDAGYAKQEVRMLARELDLPNHDMPSTACLSSRIPTGKRILEEDLSLVDAAEEFLIGLGFRQVRVRLEEGTARIEVDPEEVSRLSGIKGTVSESLVKMGFAGVTVDMRGYASR